MLNSSPMNLSPKKIVEMLDRHIIGQKEAKCCVANALRNRERRKQIKKQDPSLAENIIPKNIMMIGPTGIGKTEISRRIAQYGDYPYTKVEATNFTQIGYYGRDVDSIIRDLVDKTIINTKNKRRLLHTETAHDIVVDKILKVFVGENAKDISKEMFKEKFSNGELDNLEIEIELPDIPISAEAPLLDFPGGNISMINFNDLVSKALSGKTKKTKLVKCKVKEAYNILLKDEIDGLIDESSITEEAIKRVENEGIVFIDEIDKITGKDKRNSADVSNEGVQRDLLPLVEGTIINTKHGSVKTDHILFIASGAFHTARPSDLLPELQGRFPVRVELHPLSEKDMIRVLSEPEYNLIRQYKALMSVDKVSLKFTEDGIAKIAEIAVQMNQKIEDIGARRLHAVLEKLMEDLSFIAEEITNTEILIDSQYVSNRLDSIAGVATDRSKFIL
ncbi:ATP-dependent protease ATPase subunit HslU [Lyticum sinuosum]|uniref:ATP-dependent protease ATPase subunit HslU n=1 Tax=Lyticum sinuosum TaxID=1332059 RepID=A0AAE5AHT5_9RICK|nr:ATP-dependent protease ATPase subunit HslU [Lyticum sinuosum]MDZ5761538.1 ATP-dependent protease ATPase subunit HslU [Lyticum sinuosum]